MNTVNTGDLFLVLSACERISTQTSTIESILSIMPMITPPVTHRLLDICPRVVLRQTGEPFRSTEISRQARDSLIDSDH